MNENLIIYVSMIYFYIFWNSILLCRYLMNQWKNYIITRLKQNEYNFLKKVLSFWIFYLGICCNDDHNGLHFSTKTGEGKFPVPHRFNLPFPPDSTTLHIEKNNKMYKKFHLNRNLYQANVPLFLDTFIWKHWYECVKIIEYKLL